MNKPTTENPIPTNPSLEIRINSLSDAKSVVANMEKIHQAVQDNGLNSIEFIVANECRVEANAIIRGVLANKCKTYQSYTRTRGENVLFPLPHLPEKQIMVVSQEIKKEPKVFVPLKQSPIESSAAKRRGRPPKRKVDNVTGDAPTV